MLATEYRIDCVCVSILRLTPNAVNWFIFFLEFVCFLDDISLLAKTKNLRGKYRVWNTFSLIF